MLRRSGRNLLFIYCIDHIRKPSERVSSDRGASEPHRATMKGIVFNLLEEVVVQRFSERHWDDLLRAANVAGVYTSLGNYASADFVTLIDALAARGKTSVESTMRWFGRHAMPHLAARYPGFLSDHDGLRTFLLSLNDVPQGEVRKVYPGADVPLFDFHSVLGAADDGGLPLLVRYQSPEELCWLAEGFIQGAASHYRQAVLIQQLNCVHKGDDDCTLQCSIRNAA